MVRLVKSEVLQRLIRKDDWSELGTSTVHKIKEAIDAGRLDEAKQLTEYLWTETKGLHDLYADWCWAWYDYVADKLGEEQLGDASRATHTVWLRPFFDLYQLLPRDEFVQVLVEAFHAHRCGKDQWGDIVVREEADRYVMEFDPCGAGGRMRRGDPLAGTGPRTEPPFNFGVCKKAYPWTWNKVGVARYCIHCAMNTILTIEWGGYPIWVTEYPDDPNDPCKYIIYKDPKDTPEKYFTEVGKTKPESVK